jgi:hypothetical protein
VEEIQLWGEENCLIPKLLPREFSKLFDIDRFVRRQEKFVFEDDKVVWLNEPVEEVKVIEKPVEVCVHVVVPVVEVVAETVIVPVVEPEPVSEPVVEEPIIEPVVEAPVVEEPTVVPEVEEVKPEEITEQEPIIKNKNEDGTKIKRRGRKRGK